MRRAAFWDRWRTGIRAGETAILIALWGGGVAAAGDLVIAGVLLCAGFLVGVLAIVADPDRSRPVKVGGMVVLTAGFAGSGAMVYWRHKADEPKAPAAVVVRGMPPVLRAAAPPNIQATTPTANSAPITGPKTSAPYLPNLPPQGKAPAVSLVAECMTVGTVDNINSGGVEYDLPLGFLTPEDHGSGFSVLSIPKGSNSESDAQGVWFIPKCSVINYGSRPAVNILMKFHVRVWEAVESSPKEGGTNFRVGKFLFERDWMATAPRIGIGEEQPFVFYMRGDKARYALIKFPSQVSLMVAGEDMPSRVPLTVSGPQEVAVWPLVYEPPHPASGQ